MEESTAPTRSGRVLCSLFPGRLGGRARERERERWGGGGPVNDAVTTKTAPHPHIWPSDLCARTGASPPARNAGLARA